MLFVCTWEQHRHPSKQKCWNCAAYWAQTSYSGHGCVKSCGEVKVNQLCTTIFKLTLDTCLLSVPRHNLSVLRAEGFQITLPAICHTCSTVFHCEVRTDSPVHVMLSSPIHFGCEEAASFLWTEMYNWFDSLKAWVWRPLVCWILICLVLVEQSVLPHLFP